MKITTADEMRTIDRVTSERFGIHSLGLMENAGIAVASFVRAQFPSATRITIVCGKGNNGGDGFVAARRLHHSGKVVEVVILCDPAELKGDAANMFGRLPFRPIFIRNEQELKNETDRSLGSADIILDAILGTGFRSPVTGLYAAAIEAINAAIAPVVAVDIPSGAAADSFTLQTGLIARADAIVTFTAPRPAHIFGGLTRGPVVVAPIGSPDEAIVSALNLQVVTARRVAPLLAPRALDANKGRFGHVLVAGGSLGKAGAACMAALGALRSGAGLVTVATPRSIVGTVASFAPEIMTEPLAETHANSIALDSFSHFEGLAKGKTVLAIGPGVSRDLDTAQFVRTAVAKCTVPIVLDADGLNAFEGNAQLLNGKSRTIVLTPHPGEMARLTGKTIEQVQKDRIGICRSFAAEHECIVVLKGHRTIVASPSPDDATWVNPTGNPGMATGGTGDILTGLIAGMLAQFPSGPLAAVTAAVYLHGLSGDIGSDVVGEQPLIATDLLKFLPEAMSRTREWSREKLLRLS